MPFSARVSSAYMLHGCRCGGYVATILRDEALQEIRDVDTGFRVSSKYGFLKNDRTFLCRENSTSRVSRELGLNRTRQGPGCLGEEQRMPQRSN